VDLHDARLVEARFLELAVYVRRVHERAVLHPRSPPPQRGEALVRHGSTVELEAVPVEPPGEGRIAVEPAGVGHRGEVEAELLVERISAPEALGAAEIGEARVDAHARAGADDERVSLGDCRSRAAEEILVHHRGSIDHAPRAHPCGSAR
jgi:hypothetical protein